MSQKEESIMIAKGVKAQIFSIMARQGLTLADLAKRVSNITGKEMLNKNTFSARINGNPTLKGLYEVADALGVKITDIFPSSEKEVTVSGKEMSFGAQNMVPSHGLTGSPIHDTQNETKAAPEAHQSLQSVAFCPHCGAKVRVGVVLMAD